MTFFDSSLTFFCSSFLSVMSCFDGAGNCSFVSINFFCYSVVFFSLIKRVVSACILVMTWLDINVPKGYIACVAASTAALTAPTSPSNWTLTYPPLILSAAMSVTLAALTAVSAATTAPKNPFVSINPRASIVSPNTLSDYQRHSLQRLQKHHRLLDKLIGSR